MSGGGGSFDSAPPPISGLGNFKGVMLCNRPSDDTSKIGGGTGDEPFRSMVGPNPHEQLGLTPCRNFEPTVKTRGPSAALRRHVRWLRELQDQMRDERDQVVQDEQEQDVRKDKMKATFDQHREAVRAMMQDRDAELKRDELAKKAAKAAARVAAAAAPGSTAPALTEAALKAQKKVAVKPLWAMTEKEKDHFEEDEADDLINFAENLDFDKYVGDLEFRQAMEAIKDRTGKLQKEQEAFKNDLLANFNSDLGSQADDDQASTAAGSLEDGIDGQSILGSEYSCASSKRSRRDERREGGAARDWDSSTVGGDDRQQVDQEVKDIVEDVLEYRPQMKAIHNKKSVLKLVEKAARDRQAADPMGLVEHMRMEGPCPVPVITASADTQNRLHKVVDPSMLPYLYRSPAI
ncbi:unnamed protein product [Polarella glacialis]|uniref:Uncharacterized protein n=1 Tax=Polarella glacialis TaxID=89957 RepID=A0A813L117_POLGL|nr:unnamed protein product [Polarella glacialis]CAE8719491.1 unnamed protein product [Polarella glacialis]